MPKHFGRSKRDLFASIVDKIKQRASSWSTKMLSGAGKLILLKSVLSSMPTYTMTCFKLPQSLCKRIQSALTRFWWDSSPTSLLARILMGKYCCDTPLLECSAPANASHGWKSLLVGRDLLNKQIGWVVGNGKDIKLWSDAWLSSKERIQPMGPIPFGQQDMKVSDLLHPHLNIWNEEKIDQILPHYKPMILTLKPSLLGAPDKRIWTSNPSGDYSTKLGYIIASEAEESIQSNNPLRNVEWHSQVWKLKSPPKIKLFLWKALHGALPVGEQLMIRNVTVSTKCCRCDSSESILHLLFLCPFAQEIWSSISSVGFDSSQISSVKLGLDLVRNLFTVPPFGLDKGVLSPWICWALWIARNQLVFSNRSFTATETIHKAVQDAREWAQAQSNPSKSTVAIPLTHIQNPRSTVCFSDAAWRAESDMAGIGWTFQSTPNSTMEHSSARLNVSSALVAEALALRSASLQAVALNHKKIIFNSDSQI